MTEPGMKKCPDCAEEVRAEARKCRYCGYRFDEVAEVRRPTEPGVPKEVQSQETAQRVSDSAAPGGGTPSHSPALPIGDGSFWRSRWVTIALAFVVVSVVVSVIAIASNRHAKTASGWTTAQLASEQKTQEQTGYIPADAGAIARCISGRITYKQADAYGAVMESAFASCAKGKRVVFDRDCATSFSQYLSSTGLTPPEATPVSIQKMGLACLAFVYASNGNTGTFTDVPATGWMPGSSVNGPRFTSANATLQTDGSITALPGIPTRGTAPPTEAAPSATPADMPTYVSQIAGVIGESRRQLSTMIGAIGEAKSAPDAAMLAARGVVSERQALLVRVQGWSVPTGGEQAQSLLMQALRASITSDSSYTAWMQDLTQRDQAAANRAYAKARANDPKATALKRRFLSVYNQLRLQVGLPSLGQNKLF